MEKGLKEFHLISLRDTNPAVDYLDLNAPMSVLKLRWIRRKYDLNERIGSAELNSVGDQVYEYLLNPHRIDHQQIFA